MTLHIDNTLQHATFAGGCFWCMVKPFDEFEGIEKVVSGYMGGHVENPSYEQIKTGTTGHYEVVQITFNPELFPYTRLLEIYWQQVDPTDPEGQFHDRGPQYRTAIFYHNQEQQEDALASRDKLEQSQKFTKPIVTKVIVASTFYPAEEYHQNYYKKSPKHYKEDRKNSGRDEFLQVHWNESE